MSVEKSITDELESIPQLTDRIFPISAKVLDKDEKPTKVPLVIYESNQSEDIKTLDGYIKSNYVSFRFEVIAETYTEAKELYWLVLNKIKSFVQQTIGSDGLFISDIEHGEPIEGINNRLNTVTLETKIYF